MIVSLFSLAFLDKVAFLLESFVAFWNTKNINRNEKTMNKS